LHPQRAQVEQPEEQCEIDLRVAMVDLRHEGAVDRGKDGARVAAGKAPAGGWLLNRGFDELLHVDGEHGRGNAVPAQVAAVDPDPRLVDPQDSRHVPAQLLAGHVFDGYRDARKLHAPVRGHRPLDAAGQEQLPAHALMGLLKLHGPFADHALKLPGLALEQILEAGVQVPEEARQVGHDVVRHDRMLPPDPMQVPPAQRKRRKGAQGTKARFRSVAVQKGGQGSVESARRKLPDGYLPAQGYAAVHRGAALQDQMNPRVPPGGDEDARGMVRGREAWQQRLEFPFQNPLHEVIVRQASQELHRSQKHDGADCLCQHAPGVALPEADGS